MKTKQLILASFVTCFLLSSISAQEFSRRVELEVDGETHQLVEFGALIGEVDGELKFLLTMPSDHLQKAYKGVDIKEEDKILMMNGKRIRTVAEFKELYDVVEIGADVKLGLRRGEEMFIRSFPKIDPEDAPQMVMRVSRDDGEGGNEDITLAAELSMLLRGKGDRLEVETIEGLGEVDGLDIATGDIISKLNGKPLSSTEEWDKQYAGIAVGEELTIEVLRNGKTIRSTLKKPASRGRVMMRSN